MPDKTLTHLTLSETAALLGAREISSLELTDAYLERIAKADGTIGAYISLTAEKARACAENADKLRASGERLSPLAGIPCAIKDNICTDFGTTTCASRMLSGFRSPYSAAVIERLERSGCVFLGKTNLDEFAMGSTTENSAFRSTRNPRDVSRVPGGSSGGSAAAVAADEAVFALGSDTGGSIRQPASFCGVVGFKPTYGRVSRYGLVAFASSLDQIGPLSKSVADSAMILESICGADRRDTTCLDRSAEGFTSSLSRGVKGMHAALPVQMLGSGVADEVRDAVISAARTLEKLGATVDEVSMPSLDLALAAYYIISSAEASSNLGRFDGVRYGYRAEGCENLDELYLRSRSEGFGSEVKRRIMLGTFALSAGYYDEYYKKALKIRTRIKSEYDRVFEKYDVILSPVAPAAAYKLGEKTGDPLEMYMGDICTVPVNIAGLPAISLPCGETSAGLPIGLQIIGRAFGESDILGFAAALEHEIGIYHSQKEAYRHD
mgnify:CR=1 FL=1